MAVTGPTNVATWTETEGEWEQCSREGAGTPTQVTPEDTPVAGKEQC